VGSGVWCGGGDRKKLPLTGAAGEASVGVQRCVGEVCMERVSAFVLV